MNRITIYLYRCEPALFLNAFPISFHSQMNATRYAVRMRKS